MEQKMKTKGKTKHNARVIYPEKITDRDREEAMKILMQEKYLKIIEKIIMK